MKRIYGITGLDVKSLENNEFSQLMTESKEAIAAFNKAHKVESIYTSKLEEMSQHLTKFQEGLHQTKASRLVTSLDQTDRERDDALGTLTALVRAFIFTGQGDCDQRSLRYLGRLAEKLRRDCGCQL